MPPPLPPPALPPAAEAAALAAALEALSKTGHALLALLCQADVEGLAAHHLQVHLRHGLRRLLRRREAHEPEPLRRALVIRSDSPRRDLPERAEKLLQLVIIDRLV